MVPVHLPKEAQKGEERLTGFENWDHLLVPGRRAHLAWQPSGSALLSPSPASCTSVHILPNKLWNQPPTTRGCILPRVADPDPH